MPHHPSQRSEAEPGGAVAVQIRRRVRPGQEPAYEAQLQALMADTRQLPGYLGGNTERAQNGAAEYTSVIRFDSLARLQEFEASARRRAFAAAVADLVESEAELQHLTGLEVWFVPPAAGPSAAPQPVRWRMALVLVAVVYGLITLLSLLLTPWLGALPPALRMLLVVSLQVLLMTYLVMPGLTRWLAPWLFPQPAPRHRHPAA